MAEELDLTDEELNTLNFEDEPLTITPEVQNQVNPVQGEINSAGTSNLGDPVPESPVAPISPDAPAVNPADFVGAAQPEDQAVTPTPNLTQGSLDEIENAVRARQNAIAVGADIGAAQAAAEAAKLREYDNQLEQSIAEKTLADQKRRQELINQEAKVAQAIEESSNIKIDPDRYWNSKTTGDKILAGISVLLGGFSTNKDAVNKPLEMINKSIEQDINAQKEALQSSRFKAQDQRNLLADMRARLNNDIAAEAATRAAILQRTRNQLEAISANYKGAREQAKASEAISLLDQQIAEAKLNTQQALAAQTVKNTPAQQAVDKEFGKEYVEFVTKGGIADAAKNLSQLRDAKKALQQSSTITGPVVGSIPDSVKKFVNPKSISVREAVEEVIQRNLRVVLGAQFTEKEGDRLIARAFNPNLDEKENIKRLERLEKQVAEGIKAKVKAAKYYEKFGTLRGFKGNLITSGDQLLPEFQVNSFKPE